MSGKPSPEGTRIVLEMLENLNKLDHEIAQLSGAVAKLKKAKEDKEELERELWKKMEAMDLASSGNWGHEARMIWFLQHMAKLASANGYILRREQEEKKGEKPECCERPPNGWFCTLPDGHDGPCPTVREGTHCDKVVNNIVCGHKRPCPAHDNNVKRSW